ncbi:DUF4166 domain-containing protein [Rhodanobacter sp. L36]|uniref:DUF4166 domain-containing protein n=1 Tax=Rhodanobacter sp. L36 TaxID=1747221 RepID=UPI0020B17113|nr:DUF4166 domain-containing protein [Rhodanobacter sp. L36]
MPAQAGIRLPEKPAHVAGFFMAGCRDERDPAYHSAMTTTAALFPSLLGDAWYRLASPVQAMHGDTPRLLARGSADVEGATGFLARWNRRLLGLPEPGPAQPLEVSIERNGTRETWTRRFADGQMQSVLDLVKGRPLLCERLGPAALHFELRFDAGAIDWRLYSVRLLGVPIPRGLLGSVVSRSGESNGRYAFHIDVRLPLLGRLIAYRGWLEIVDGG